MQVKESTLVCDSSFSGGFEHPDAARTAIADKIKRIAIAAVLVLFI